MSRWKAYYRKITDWTPYLSDRPYGEDDVVVDPNVIIKDKFRVVYATSGRSGTAFFIINNGLYRAYMKAEELVNAVIEKKTIVEDTHVYIEGEFRLCKKGTCIFLKLL